jgi:hypothetical protein
LVSLALIELSMLNLTLLVEALFDPQVLFLFMLTVKFSGLRKCVREFLIYLGKFGKL